MLVRTHKALLEANLRKAERLLSNNVRSGNAVREEHWRIVVEYCKRELAALRPNEIAS